MSLEIPPNFVEESFETVVNGEREHVFCFRSFRLNVAERQLTERGTLIPLTPKSFDVLACLVANSGRLVHKDHLIKAVWPDSFVEETNLTRAIHTLRKALGQDQNGNQFIETVPTKGYRFVADVREILPAEEPGESKRRQADYGGQSVEASTSIVEQASSDHRLSGRLIALGGLLILVAISIAVWFSGAFWTQAVRNKSGSKGSQNGEAFRSFEQGRVIIRNRLADHLKESLPYFERAIALDPSYADAYAARADVLVWTFWETGGHDDIGRARADVKKALELDPENSYAFTVRCRIVGTYDWDFKAAESDCRRAIALDSENADAHHELAMLLSPLGRPDEALAEIETAIALEPTSFFKRNKGLILFYAGRFGEAIDQLEHVKATDPSLSTVLHWLTWCYAMNGDYAKAAETLELWRQIRKNTDANIPPTGANAKADRPTVFNGILEQYQSGNKNQPFVAAAYCQLGEMDKVFEWLESGIKARKLWMIHIGPDPRFEPCRDDPRFSAILRRVGLV